MVIKITSTAKARQRNTVQSSTEGLSKTGNERTARSSPPTTVSGAVTGSSGHNVRRKKSGTHKLPKSFFFVALPWLLLVGSCLSAFVVTTSQIVESLWLQEASLAERNLQQQGHDGTQESHGIMSVLTNLRRGANMTKNSINESSIHLQHEQNANPYNFEATTRNAPVCSPIHSHHFVSYTLVTQSSEDRLWMMEHFCKAWPHSISIAILAPQMEGQKQKTSSDFLDTLQAMGCKPEHLSIAVVTEASLNGENLDSAAGAAEGSYPINVLRNRALEQVQTTHAVYLDIDFWPSSNLFKVLNQISIRQQLLQKGDKTALVVPAFQIFRQCREYADCREENVQAMPQTRQELVHKFQVDHSVFQFDPTNLGGHGSTRYVQWLSQSPTKLLEIPCFLSDRYEPYLVFRHCQNVPPFQEAFSGYGKNKMTWVMQLRRMGWKFYQLGSVFATHYPHLDSQTRQLWNGGRDGQLLKRPDDDQTTDFMSYRRGQVDHIFLEFKKWLLKSVPDQSIVPKCYKDEQLSALLPDDDYRLWVPTHDIEEYRRIADTDTDDEQDEHNDSVEDGDEESEGQLDYEELEP